MNAEACGRAVPVAETLARILPLRRAAGVTRCADVTGLDHLGIPVICAVRPRGRALGVTNGKGLTRDQALVGAIMEAIELHHAENPPHDLPVESFESHRAAGANAVDPRTLPDFVSSGHSSPRYRTPWTRALDLANAREVWLPASSAYLSWPATCLFSSNGLASGNDIDEATLHALLELLERDAVSSLVVDGALRFDQCDVMDMTSLPQGTLRDLQERLARAAVRTVLLRVPSRIPVHTFWCVLLDERPFAGASMVRFGRASHMNPEHAAIRSLLEAAQARLTAIHGAREDVHEESYAEGPVHHKAARFFGALPAETPWSDLEPERRDTTPGTLAHMIEELRRVGSPNVYRVDMTRPPFDVPVVKVIVPGLVINQALF